MERIESLSIVLPCRDEERNVGPVVRDALRMADVLAERAEVVVVDDGSRDGTVRVAEEAAQRSEARVPLRVVRHARGRGYGAALRSGFEAARGHWVLYADADRQFELADAARLVALLPEHDLVCGYRRPRADGLGRELLGRAWSALVDHVLGTGLRDVNCGLKLFPRALFERIEVESAGALVDAEIVAKARALGYRIGEVPVRHRPRPEGRASGARPEVIVRALYELWRARDLGVAGAPSEAQAQMRSRPARFAS
ncbi:MAG: glycosyltransferase family 2 protein [Myxococcota bacterium]